jgi:FMN-dependent NADH-azoreductase
MSKPDLDFSGEDSGFSGDYLDSQTEREKRGFSTRLRAELIEKLRAAAFHDSLTIQKLVNRAVARIIQEREEQRGEPYEVQPTQRVK